jgi:hypothetical protein
MARFSDMSVPRKNAQRLEEQVVVRMPKVLRVDLETEAQSEERPLSNHIRWILSEHTSQARSQGGARSGKA